MFRNYNWRNFNKLEQYNALVLLLSNSKKTRNYPAFPIENVLNDEWLLLFLLNQKKYIETSREKNPFWNIMYKLTRKWRNFIEWFFFSKTDYLFLIVINFIIFILPIFTYLWIKIVNKKMQIILEDNIVSNINISLIIIWLILILYIIAENRWKIWANYGKFKKKYNIN